MKYIILKFVSISISHPVYHSKICLNFHRPPCICQGNKSTRTGAISQLVPAHLVINVSEILFGDTDDQGGKVFVGLAIGFQISSSGSSDHRLRSYMVCNWSYRSSVIQMIPDYNLHFLRCLGTSWHVVRVGMWYKLTDNHMPVIHLQQKSTILESIRELYRFFVECS